MCHNSPWLPSISEYDIGLGIVGSKKGEDNSVLRLLLNRQHSFQGTKCKKQMSLALRLGGIGQDLLSGGREL